MYGDLKAAKKVLMPVERITSAILFQVLMKLYSLTVTLFTTR